MLKQAFRSYLSAIHPRNIKKLKENGNGFMFVYWLFIYPILMSNVSLEGGDTAKYIWFTMIKMIPFLLMGWSNISSKFLMPKAMYLCPMKEEERREYVNAVLFVKIGVPVLVGMVLELIWSYFYGFRLWQFLGIVFMNFSLGVSTYICIDAAARGDRRISFARKDKKGRVRWAWMNIVSMILAMLLLIGLEIPDLTEEMSFDSSIIIGFSIVLLLIFDVLIIATQYKCTVESAGDYELNYHVYGKVKTQDMNNFDIFNR